MNEFVRALLQAPRVTKRRKSSSELNTMHCAASTHARHYVLMTTKGKNKKHPLSSTSLRQPRFPAGTQGDSIRCQGLF